MPRRSNTRRSVVGLELDPGAVHAVAVDGDGPLCISDAAVVALEPGVVRDGEIVDGEGLTEALRALWREHSHLDRRVRIGLANQKIVVRVIELPPIADRKELEAAVRFRAQDEVPMPLDAAVLDFHVLDVFDTPAGPRQRVLIVAARRDMIDKVLAATRAAGLRPEGIDLAAFAMVRALHGAAPASEQVLYLSIGGLTNLAVAQGPTCVFTRVIGGGLEGIAIELAERRALTLDEARGLLVRIGLDRPLEALEVDSEIVPETRAILLEGVRRIASDVRNSLDFHHGQGGEVGVERAVVTGPAAAVPGFAEALSAELGLPVERGAISGAPAGLDAERLVVAAGLAVEEVPA